MRVLYRVSLNVSAMVLLVFAVLVSFGIYPEDIDTDISLLISVGLLSLLSALHGIDTILSKDD